MNFLQRFAIEHRVLTSYALIGALTTIIGYVLFYVLHYPLPLGANIANIISITGAVTFSYVMNKRYVFRTRCKDMRELSRELLLFVSSRAASILAELLCVFIMTVPLRIEGIIAKLAAGIIVMVLNYYSSTLIVFRKKRRVSAKERARPELGKHAAKGYETDIESKL